MVIFHSYVCLSEGTHDKSWSSTARSLDHQRAMIHRLTSCCAGDHALISVWWTNGHKWLILELNPKSETWFILFFTLRVLDFRCLSATPRKAWIASIELITETRRHHEVRGSVKIIQQFCLENRRLCGFYPSWDDKNRILNELFHRLHAWHV